MDCQEEEEIPEELESQEEEQPQTEVDLACASVQIVHAPPITVLDNTPEIVDSSYPKLRETNCLVLLSSHHNLRWVPCR